MCVRKKVFPYYEFEKLKNQNTLANEYKSNIFLSFSGITKSDSCPGDEVSGSTPKEWCPRVHTCHTCMATKGCEWDGVKVSNCHEMKHRLRE